MYQCSIVGAALLVTHTARIVLAMTSRVAAVIIRYVRVRSTYSDAAGEDTGIAIILTARLGTVTSLHREYGVHTGAAVTIQYSIACR